MKIDPTERSAQVPRQVVDHTNKKQEQCGFDAVLQQTLQKTGPSKECMESSLRNITAPLSPLSVPPNPENPAETLAHNLLDRLEDYQKMLGDPDVSLRNIQPVVEQLEKQTVSTLASIVQMPEAHPLKTIIQDTIASINQEVARFNAGYYVDD